MDSCPAELIAHILEYMPVVHLGNTARSLGLVSKYYRRVAKPFEFRALVIIGSEQLKATFGKIETELVERAVIDVRHLFVCEEDPDMNLNVRIFSDDSMDEEEETTYIKKVKEYIAYANEFRKYAAALVRDVHTTLVTLSITQCFRRTSSDFGDLRIISGLSFPCLENLILKHSASISEFDFVRPTAPLLRRIHLNAPRVYYNTMRDHPDYEEENLWPHPLLVDMHSRFEALTHLVLFGGGMDYVDDLLEVLCGSDSDAMEFKSTISTNRRLPGRLVHAVMKPLYSYDLRKTKNLCRDAEALYIDGLVIHEPQWQVGEFWEREDEILKEFEGLARERW
ncbi:hypothetical protein M0805_008248 [Coniferiporia weirii]|nr:hypothetical protein M0805_008248 [Coniferiporia weirii]